MKVDKREYLSRLIGFFPEVVMPTLENRTFIEETIFVLVIKKLQYLGELSFEHDQRGLIKVKSIEDHQNFYYVFQCKEKGIYPLVVNTEKSDGTLSVLMKGVITINKSPFSKNNMSFENI